MLGFRKVNFDFITEIRDWVFEVCKQGEYEIYEGTWAECTIINSMMEL